MSGWITLFCFFYYVTAIKNNCSSRFTRCECRRALAHGKRHRCKVEVPIIDGCKYSFTRRYQQAKHTLSYLRSVHCSLRRESSHVLLIMKGLEQNVQHILDYFASKMFALVVVACVVAVACAGPLHSDKVPFDKSAAATTCAACVGADQVWCYHDATCYPHGSKTDTEPFACPGSDRCASNENCMCLI